MDSFDFDEWATLAQSAPDAFEQRRHEQVEHIISEGTNARRLRGLQCRIEMERMRSHTPMRACLRISALMWDSLLECRFALNTLIYKSPKEARKLLLHNKRAEVIQLHRKG